MIVTYLRSSSVNTYSFCQQKYYMNYVLGIKDKDNGKAQMGNVVHKALELFGRYKLAKQLNKKTFIDNDFGKISFKNVSVEYFIDLAHAHYEALIPGLMPKNSKAITLEWTHLALTRLDGDMDPRNQNIYAVEEFFEVEVPHEWADYEYLVGDKIIKGRLGLKGTVDLILQEDDVYFHICDYKTGRRYDWSKDSVKEYSDLEFDKQLLLYYYALRLKYPDKQFYVSIYYINDHQIDGAVVPGGLFSFAFDDAHFRAAEVMIKNEFDKIRNTKSPKLLSNTLSSFKCKHLCAYSSIIDSISTERPACLHIQDEIKKKGIDAVTLEYGNLDKMLIYTGGGRSEVRLNEKE